MRMVQDWPFKSERLELTRAERATLLRAAAIAEKATTFFDEKDDYHQWMDWKALAMHAAESAEVT